MNHLKLFTLSCVVFLYGCASGAKFENMAYTEKAGIPFDKTLSNNIGVSGVSGGESTNPMWTSEISNEAFREALKLSLSWQKLLSETGRYQLKVELVNVDQPMFGLDLEVTTNVRYILTDTKNNKVVLDESVIVGFTATLSDALMAFERLRIANEGSSKANIKGFIEKLSELNLKEGEVSIAK
ncbi:MAG: hypothetical protein OEY19_04470 [Gammaproteobacteria bacterium]|nr:hypothetical protein [Gammaproteobacteria bacterium]MDH5630017.1 hypothetical protein [Gammaproteobacteria bacterium]